MMASILLGKYAPIDFADASGTNLFDIRRKKWYEFIHSKANAIRIPKALAVTAPDLLPRLGEPCASHSVLGSIHTSFQHYYGFRDDCQIVSFSGDNPNSIAGILGTEQFVYRN